MDFVIADKRFGGLLMKAMVLAAGKGTRLAPLTDELPKPMAPVVNKPVIEHVFELLAGARVKEVYVNVSHLSDVILGHYGEKTHIEDMQINFCHEEQLMGTAGGVKRLARHFSETFVVIMGDALTDVDVQSMVAFHKKNKALATLALVPVSDPSRYGVVELDSEGSIRRFQEKPEPGHAISNLANTGIYVLEPEVLDYIPEDTFFDFAQDVFPRLLEAGERFMGYEGNFYWLDIGTLQAYRAAQYDVLSGKVCVEIPGYQMGENLWVDTGVEIHPTAVFEGHSVIGGGTVIEQKATLVGDTIVGSGCRVHPESTVKRSILFPNSHIGEGSCVEDCIVGPDYEVRPGERIRGETLMTWTSPSYDRACRTKTYSIPWLVGQR